MEVTKYRDYTSKDIGYPRDQFTNLLSQLAGTPHMVGSGTALGLWRDGSLIPTDTDIDFIYEINDFDSNGKLVDHIKSQFNYLPLILEVTHEGKTQQLAFQHPDFILDFHFYRRNQTNGMSECYHQGGVLSFDFSGGSMPIETQYGIVYVPRLIEEMLEREYGYDWKVPQHRKKPSLKTYRRGLLFGVFDPLHYGHVRLFQACKALCDELYVVVRTDEHIRAYKQREPFIPEQDRVNDVAGVVGEQYTILDHGNIGWDAFARWQKELGADVFFASIENQDKVKLPVPVIYMDRTPGVSSSQLRQQL